MGDPRQESPVDLKPSSYDPHLQEVMLDLKAAATTLIVFLALLCSTLVFLLLNVFGGPGTWVDDNIGTPSLGYGGVAVLAVFTAIFGLAFRHVHLRLRNHPMYGKGPRR
jgi:hypothetical protein